MFNFPAFDLTTEEKQSVKSNVDSLLRECAGLLDGVPAKLSADDRADALQLVKEAMYLATDPDAGEYAPIGECNLYLGHVLGASDRFLGARDAYSRAAQSLRDHDGSRSVAGEEAIELAKMMDRRVREGKRYGGHWEKYELNSSQARDHLLSSQSTGASQADQLYLLDMELWDLQRAVCIQRGAFREKPTIVDFPPLSDTRPLPPAPTPEGLAVGLLSEDKFSKLRSSVRKAERRRY